MSFTYPSNRTIYLSKNIEDEDFIENILKNLNALANESEEPIYLVINSIGGLRVLAFAICDAIRISRAPVYTVIQGQALSSAAIIFLAGEKRYITKYSRIMIHDVSVDGIDKKLTESDFKNFRKKLEKTNKEIVQFVMERTGLSRRKVKNLMKKERELRAKEAVKFGFAHQII